jgi:hypothetical protein
MSDDKTPYIHLDSDKVAERVPQDLVRLENPKEADSLIAAMVAEREWHLNNPNEDQVPVSIARRYAEADTALFEALEHTPAYAGNVKDITADLGEFKEGVKQAIDTRVHALSIKAASTQVKV